MLNKKLIMSIETSCDETSIAILKDGSPSCGVNYVYDGTFTGNKIKGRGITAEILVQNGISVISENDLGGK